jgi:peptidoglycan/LPS O-acetylase OafA/YrhL
LFDVIKFNRKPVKLDIITNKETELIITYNEGDYPNDNINNNNTNNNLKTIIQNTINNKVHVLLSKKVSNLKIRVGNINDINNTNKNNINNNKDKSNINNNNIDNAIFIQTISITASKRIKINNGEPINSSNGNSQEQQDLLTEYKHNDLIKGKKRFYTDTKKDNISIFILLTLFVSIFMLVENKKINKWIENKEINNNNNINSIKYKNLEFLRILFSIGIVLCHITLTFSFGNIKANSIIVEYFFIISGFLLFKIIDQKIDKISTKDFIVKRYIRLFPIYLFCILIMLTFIQKKSMAIFYYIFGAQVFIGDEFHVNSGVLWFVPIIFWIGVIIFLLFKTFKKEIALFLLGVLTYLCIFCNYGYGKKGNIFLSGGSVRGMATMGLGCFVYIFYKNFKLPNINTKIGKYFITAFELLIFSILLRCSINFDGFPLTVCLNMSILLYLFMERKGMLSNILDNNISVWFGKYSFALYCCHETIVKDIFRKIGLYKFLHFTHLQEGFAIIIFSIFIAIILYHTIEKPIGDWLSKKYEEK